MSSSSGGWMVLANVGEALSLSEQLSKSGLVPETLRGKPADILVVLGAGSSLGLDPFCSLRSIHVVKGRPILSADLMAALVRRSGLCKSLMTTSSDDACEVVGKRADSGDELRVKWTLAEAEKAGLTRNPTWQAYRRQMLRARAVAELCRALWPDVVSGIYTPGEIPEDDEVVDVRHVTPPAPVKAIGPLAGEVAKVVSIAREAKNGPGDVADYSTLPVPDKVAKVAEVLKAIEADKALVAWDSQAFAVEAGKYVAKLVEEFEGGRETWRQAMAAKAAEVKSTPKGQLGSKEDIEHAYILVREQALADRDALPF